MREQAVAMYCFLDDFIAAARLSWARPSDPRCHLSNAKILTTALVAARYLGGNWHLAQRYMEQH